MDQKLLNALNNLSDGLEAIAEALKAKSGDKSPTTDALQSGNFTKSIKEINVGVKQLMADSKQILKNQQTIIELSKRSSSDKKSEFENAGGDKKQESNIKKGVGTILLIAIGVLAIGMAFKLVGGVDFLSVIGLSIAILLIAKAFEKVAALNMGLKEAAIVSASLVLMSLGITMASWILTNLSDIGTKQLLTMVMIGVGFSLLSPAIGKIIKAFKDMSWGQLAKAAVGLVLVLPAIALGITLASWMLTGIIPIKLDQIFTAIMIAGMFTVVSFGIKKMLNAFGTSLGSLVKAVIFLPLVLPAIALGIAMSSWELQKITPIKMEQAITGIMISAMFAVIGFGLKKLLGAFGGNSILGIGVAILFLPTVMEAVADGIVRASRFLNKTEKVGWTQAWSAIMIAVIFTVISFGLNKLITAVAAIKNPLAILLVPLILPAMAYAIQLSSDPLSKVTVMKMDQFFTALGISIIFVAFAFALKLMSSAIDKIDLGAVVKIPLIFVAFSTAIWLSSKILVKATVMEDDFLIKLLKMSVVMGIAFIVMGGVTYVLGKIGFTNIMKGVLAIPVLATAIMLSSHILSAGNYADYPSLGWSFGVGSSLLVFGGAAYALGSIIMTGIGGVALLAGAAGVLGVAATIVAASHILAEGSYTKYPSLGWSTSVALSLGAFTTGMVLLGGMIIASFGIGAAALAAGSEAVLGVAQTIVDTSFILAKGKWTKGPTVAWASGVAIALAAFSPIYAMLMANGVAKIFGGGGIGPEDFSTAITTVSKGIIDAASFFADPKNKGVWKGGPTKEWAEGVGTAIGAFSPVYGMLLANGIADMIGGGGIGPEEFSSAIVTVSKGIITAAKEFADNTAPFAEGTYPSAKWGEGVGGALLAFAPVFKALSEDTGIFKSEDKVISGMVNGILRIAGAIVGVAKKFSDPKVSWTSYPNANWSKMVKNSVVSYVNVAKEIDEMDVDNWTLHKLHSTVERLVKVAKLMSMNSKHFNAKINPNFMKSISSNLYFYMAVAEKLSSKQGGLGSMLKGAFKGDPMINMANGMVHLAKAYDKLAVSLTKLGAAMNGINDKKISQMERMTRINSNKSKEPTSAVGGVLSSIFSGGSTSTDVAPPVSVVSPVSVGKKSEGGSKGKYGDISRQNDMMIELLRELNAKLGEGSNIDSAMIKNLSEKKDSALQ